MTTINDEIEKIITNHYNQQNHPQKIIITKKYTRKDYIDFKSDNCEILTYIQAIGNQIEKNNIGILFDINGEWIVITKWH